MNSGSLRVLSFGGHALDLQRCAVTRGDHEIQLRPKAFDVLRYLAEHAGRVVSKEELIKAAWPDVFVTDHSLVQCIKDIREALSDDAHQIIKTMPRRGYLFAAELTDRCLDEPQPTTGTRGQEITFCRTNDGVNIAVACVGQGMPLVCIPTWATHLEYDWQSPIRDRFAVSSPTASGSFAMMVEVLAFPIATSLTSPSQHSSVIWRRLSMPWICVLTHFWASRRAPQPPSLTQLATPAVYRE